MFTVEDTNCGKGFGSFEDIQKKSKLITKVNGDYNKGHVFYKDIKFNCNGVITHVIIGSNPTNQQHPSNPPKLQIWRIDNNANDYSPTGPSVLLYYNISTPDVSTKYLRWYNLSEPLFVQKGDVFGIYQPPDSDDPDSVIYYKRYSGPIHYQQLYISVNLNIMYIIWYQSFLVCQ